MDYIDEIYYTLLGEMLPEYAVAGVENAFSEGSPCSCAQETLDGCLDRLRCRLGAENLDLEALTDGFLTIQRILCRKMFLYGEKGKVPEE